MSTRMISTHTLGVLDAASPELRRVSPAAIAVGTALTLQDLVVAQKPAQIAMSESLLGLSVALYAVSLLAPVLYRRRIAEELIESMSSSPNYTVR